MKIILIKDVAKLGRKNDVKTVSDGYALNLLIPEGKAIPATPEALKRLEANKIKEEGEKKIQDNLISTTLKDLGEKTLVIVGKANEKGHLFAGLHNTEISKELLKQFNINIDPVNIIIPGPLKEVGQHIVGVDIEGKKTKFKVKVEAK